ncbi:MAG TPA: diaminopimelate decarboxylase [Phycisphaerales bacterium]|nr:diaminopimelate decarboxylase [Phycisphaerales bacterium]
MDHFTYQSGRLTCEGLDLATLAAAPDVGTPVYVYSAATLRDHYTRLAEAFKPLDPLICFSVKSCSNLSVLKTLAALGAGMDVVSGGELCRARLAGVHPSKIVYAGVGKTDDEIISALGRPADDEPRAVEGPGGTGLALQTSDSTNLGYSEPIGLFNVESEQEFQAISTLAQNLNVRARAALRVNPDVDPHTHKYTTTGTAETKFGVDITRAKAFFKSYDGHPFLKLCGLHIHLGSPVLSPQPYVQAITRILALADELERDGHRIEVLNLGGGFGADYTTGQSIPAVEYAKEIVPLLHERLEKRWADTGRRTKIILEPGRTIAANAGILLTRVQYIKTSGAKKFLVCDAGMHTLLRPALYEAFHFIWPVSVAPQHVPPERARDLSPSALGTQHSALSTAPPGLEPCDIVGPICETGDLLSNSPQTRNLPPIARGDLLAIFTAGAYGMTMASRYNSHPLPAEVLVDNGKATIIRRRETYADLVEHEMTTEHIGV